MIKYIVCDDNEEVVAKSKFIINKVMMPYDYDYQTFCFNDYNSKLESIIKDQNGQKVYILDIELPSLSGIEIADKIREYDWDSIIIILTSHSECKDSVFESRLMVLDYISKFAVYEKTLEKTLKKALSILNKKNVLKYSYNYTTYRIPYEEILYIKASRGALNIIYTKDKEEYETNLQLKELDEILGPTFHRCHKNCLVNIENVKSVTASERKIVFKNGSTEKLISFRMRKDFADYVSKLK